MSDTRHRLADCDGKAALMQIDKEDLARIVAVGLKCGMNDIAVEDLIRRLIDLGIFWADQNPEALTKTLCPKGELGHDNRV